MARAHFPLARSLLAVFQQRPRASFCCYCGCFCFENSAHFLSTFSCCLLAGCVLMACFFFLSFFLHSPSLTQHCCLVHHRPSLCTVGARACAVVRANFGLVCVCVVYACVFVGCGLCDAAAGFGACALPACAALFHSPAILRAHAVAQPQPKAQWHLPARHGSTKFSTKQQNSDAPS